MGLYVNGNNRRTSYDAIYFDSFVVGHIPKEILKIHWKKNILANIYRIQACNSIMCGYFCIGFIDFMLRSNSLLDDTYLFFLMIMRRKIK